MSMYWAVVCDCGFRIVGRQNRIQTAASGHKRNCLEAKEKPKVMMYESLDLTQNLGEYIRKAAESLELMEINE